MLKDEDYQPFAVALVGVATALGQTLDAGQVNIYWMVLRRKFDSMNHFQEAWMSLLDSWTYGYMPKPAHFIESGQLSKEELELIALKAWDRVRDALKDGVGYNTNAEFEDALIPTVVHLIGGFERLAIKTHSELEWKKKEFIGSYIGAVKSKIPIKTNVVACEMDFATTKKFNAEYKLPHTGKDCNKNLLPQGKFQKTLLNLAEKVRF
jgi:hypothetical protein